MKPGQRYRHGWIPLNPDGSDLVDTSSPDAVKRFYGKYMHVDASAAKTIAKDNMGPKELRVAGVKGSDYETTTVKDVVLKQLSMVDPKFHKAVRDSFEQAKDAPFEPGISVVGTAEDGKRRLKEVFPEHLVDVNTGQKFPAHQWIDDSTGSGLTISDTDSVGHSHGTMGGVSNATGLAVGAHEHGHMFDQTNPATGRFWSEEPEFGELHSKMRDALDEGGSQYNMDPYYNAPWEMFAESYSAYNIGLSKDLPESEVVTEIVATLGQGLLTWEVSDHPKLMEAGKGLFDYFEKVRKAL